MRSPVNQNKPKRKHSHGEIVAINSIFVVFTKGLANEKKKKETPKIESFSGPCSALLISFFMVFPLSDRNENYTSNWKWIEV